MTDIIDTKPQPRNGTVVNVQLPPDLLRQLDELVMSMSRARAPLAPYNRSEVIRMLLMRGLREMSRPRKGGPR